MSLKHTKPASSIPDGAKTVLAQLYQVMHLAGKSRRAFVGDLCAAGYEVSGRQLDRWVERIKGGDAAVSTDKASGAEALLSREQRDIVGGWVLAQNLIGAPVHLAGYRSFCHEQFKQRLSAQTASRYLREDGFSYRIMQNKARGFTVDIEAMRAQAWEWIQRMRSLGIFDVARSHLASLDFTFTGHRTERHSSFASQGGSQPVSAESVSTFTNCVITCLWADGVNRTPSMLFTYNAAFRHDRNPTTRRAAQVKHLDEALRKYHIAPNRVVYVGESKGETRTYVPESPALLRQFFKNYKAPQGAVALSDNGNSLFEEGKSVLLGLGFERHECYPAAVHQYLSPNDNHLHGTAKQAWRNSGVNCKDDVENCLCFLWQLDQDTKAHGRQWFDQNILRIREAEVESMIGPIGGRFSDLHASWLTAYRVRMGIGPQGNGPANILDDALIDDDCEPHP